MILLYILGVIFSLNDQMNASAACLLIFSSYWASKQDSVMFTILVKYIELWKWSVNDSTANSLYNKKSYPSMTIFLTKICDELVVLENNTIHTNKQKKFKFSGGKNSKSLKEFTKRQIYCVVYLKKRIYKTENSNSKLTVWQCTIAT